MWFVLRREMTEMPVYLLTVDKGGPRLATLIDLSKLLITGSSDEALNFGIGADSSGDMVTRLTVRKRSMTAVASALAFQTNRPVVDRTGLTGRYDFDLKFAVDNADAASAALGFNPINPKTGNPPKYATGPSLFNALREIGLRLDAGNAPVEVLVIERVEKPSEN